MQIRFFSLEHFPRFEGQDALLPCILVNVWFNDVTTAVELWKHENSEY